MIVVVAVLVVLLIASVVGLPAAAVPLFLAMSVLVTGSAAIWALLRTRSQRRTYDDQLAAWAAARAVQSERLRVARDLHDVVSHSLGLITLRAAGARRQLESGHATDPAGALSDIEDVSRQATIELRRMLGLLRDESADPAPLHPAARLEDVPALVEQSRRYGLDVGLHVGQLGAVTPGVQMAVAAVVREALTNTARHAGPTSASVDIRRDADTITVSVQDDGPADHWTARPGAGHGLIGLRERAESLGGTFLAEPVGLGFRVVASLPDSAGR